MKLSLTQALLFSVSTSAFTPSIVTKKASTSLGFKKEAVETWVKNEPGAVADVEVDGMITNMSFATLKTEGSETAALSELADALGYKEDDIKSEYEAFCTKFDKTKDDDRYVVFKKNFLLQESYNREYQQCYLLNEFADCTFEEFESKDIMQADEDDETALLLRQETFIARQLHRETVEAWEAHKALVREQKVLNYAVAFEDVDTARKLHSEEITARESHMELAAQNPPLPGPGKIRRVVKKILFNLRLL